jgi:hypothetical protein
MMTRRGIAAARVGDGAFPFGPGDERPLPIQLAILTEYKLLSQGRFP